MNASELNKALGNIDLHLLDQILKGQLKEHMRILDAGCGEGRNLVYLLNNECDMFGVDVNPTAIKMTKMQARSLLPNPEEDHFIVDNILDLPFESGFFDIVFSINVLHLMEDEEQFLQAINEMFRVLKSRGNLMLKMLFEMPMTDLNNAVEKDKSRTNAGKFFFKTCLLKKIFGHHSCQLVEQRVEILNGETRIFLVIKKD